MKLFEKPLPLSSNAVSGLAARRSSRVAHRRVAVGVLFSAFLAINFIATSVHSAAETGKPAPSFSAIDTQGKTHRLADYAGKYVVLEWVNPGCPFVKKHYQALPAPGKPSGAVGNIPATQQEAVAKGMVWLAISTTEKDHPDWFPPAQLAAWLKDRGAAASAVLLDEDGVIGKAYGARTTPHLYIVNPSGQLVYAGGIDSIASAKIDDLKTATNYVRQTVGELVAGKPVSQPNTRPYGCSIKYKS
jgi:AhpC/TSA family